MANPFLYQLFKPSKWFDQAKNGYVLLKPSSVKKLVP